MKLRRISTCFTAALLLINVIFSEPLRFSSAEQPLPAIMKDGQPITELTLPDNEKTTVCVEDADEFQWQALIPYSDKWVDIHGEAEAECEISSAMLGSLADCCNTVQIRCDVTDDGETAYTLPLTVTLTPQDTSDENLQAQSGMKKSRKRLPADNAPDDLTTRTVTIKYRYYNEDPDMAGSVADDYVATLATGSNYSANVSSPYRTGYQAYVASDDDWNGTRWFDEDVNEAVLQGGNTFNVDITNIQENITYYVVYLPQFTNYLTRHYQQDIYDDFYSFYAEKSMQAKVGTMITIATDLGVSYEGFTLLQYDDSVVSADGSTVVDLYFDRDYHLMNFQLNGGYGSDPVYARYGAEFSMDNPIRAGYTFVKWDVLPDINRTAEQNEQAKEIAAALANGGSVTIPSFDIIFQAVWDANNVSATVVFWYENANDDGYSYVNHVVVPDLVADSQISSGTYKNLSFTGRNDKYYTYNPEKAETVTVNGDGSTYLNVYFTRNVYTIVFTDYEGPNSLVEDCTIEEHTHENCFDVDQHSPMCYGETTNDIPTPVNQYGYVDFISKIKNPTNGLMACYLNADGTKYSYYLYVDQWYYLGGTSNTDPPPTFYGIKWSSRRPTYSRDYVTYELHHSEDCYGISETNMTPERFGATGTLTPAKGPPSTTGHYGYEDRYILKIKEPTNGMMACYKGKSDFYYFFYCNNTWYFLGKNNTEHPTINGLYYGGARPEASYDVKTYQLTVMQPLHCDVPEHIHGQTGDCNGTEVVATGVGNYVYQVIKAKYMQDVSSVWPLAGQNYGYTTVPSNMSKWIYNGYGDSSSTGQITKQTNVINNLSNPNGQIVTLVTMYSPKNIQANYLIESLTGNGAYTYGEENRTFDIDPRYSQIIPTKLSISKKITGLNVLTDPPIDTSSTQQDIYYERKRYTIKFDNGYSTLYDTVPNVMYEQPLNSVIQNGKKLSEIEPSYPETLQKGVYEFDGWYTTPGYIPGTEADFNITMPSQDLIYYAKWKKATHNVTFYETYDDMLDGRPITETSYGTNPTSVMHGAPVFYASTISLEGYNFVGWFYIDDETHEKVVFLPNNMPVNKDLNVYAEWNKDTMIRYTVHYVGAEPISDSDTNGQYELDPSTFLKIADDTTGQIQEGRTKTFSAKALPELYDGYNSGYFPTLASHAVLFMEKTASSDPTVTVNKLLSDGSPCTDDSMEHTYNIEYTFYYVHLPKVQYTINYINLVTGDNNFKAADGSTVTIDSEQFYTSEAVTTERYKLINGYIADEYQKRLILTADPKKNVINFYYTEGSKPTYLIEHMTENLDGTWTLQSSEFSEGEAGNTITAYSKEYVGHEFDPDHTWINTQGVQLVPKEGDKWITEYEYNTEKDCYEASGTLYNTFSNPEEDEYALVIRFYYPLEVIPFTIEHKILGTDKYVLGDKNSSSENGTAKYGERVTADATALADDALALGYWVEGSREDLSRLTKSDIITDSNNVITFWYVDEPIEINYRIVVDGVVGTNIKGCFVTPTLDSSSSHEDVATISGSTAHPGSGYYVVGWYKDEACTRPVNALWVNNNKITPHAESPSQIIKAATYYAKVAPVTLTIKKTGNDISESDSFLFSVKGTDEGNENIDIMISVKGTGSTTISYIPCGNYTVTELTDWSWKYEPNAETGDVTVTKASTVAFENTRNTDKKWLGNETCADNCFAPYSE